MPLSADFLGVGMPPAFASLEGDDPQLVVAAGTTQATATQALSSLIEMTATGADGIILPSLGPNATIGNLFYVYNSSSSTGLVYVPVGHTLNNTLNGSLSLVTHKGAMFIQYKSKFWMSILTA